MRGESAKVSLSSESFFFLYFLVALVKELRVIGNSEVCVAVFRKDGGRDEWMKRLGTRGS